MAKKIRYSIKSGETISRTSLIIGTIRDCTGEYKIPEGTFYYQTGEDKINAKTDLLYDMINHVLYITMVDEDLPKGNYELKISDFGMVDNSPIDGEVISFTKIDIPNRKPTPRSAIISEPQEENIIEETNEPSVQNEIASEEIKYPFLQQLAEQQKTRSVDNNNKDKITYKTLSESESLLPLYKIFSSTTNEILVEFNHAVEQLETNMLHAYDSKGKVDCSYELLQNGKIKITWNPPKDMQIIPRDKMIHIIIPTNSSVYNGILQTNSISISVILNSRFDYFMYNLLLIVEYLNQAATTTFESILAMVLNRINAIRELDEIPVQDINDIIFCVLTATNSPFTTGSFRSSNNYLLHGGGAETYLSSAAIGPLSAGWSHKPVGILATWLSRRPINFYEADYRNCFFKVPGNGVFDDTYIAEVSTIFKEANDSSTSKMNAAEISQAQVTHQLSNGWVERSRNLFSRR